MATVTWEHVPAHSRRPWVLSGYRPMGTKFTSCIRSMFQSHNETGNIWTHVFGCLYFFHQGCALASFNHGEKWNHTRVLMYWAFSLAILFFSSVVAHTFNCISVETRKICFMVDYLGISIHCCGCAMAYHAFFSSDLFVGLTKNLYLPASALEITLATAICCWSLIRATTWKYGTACRGCAYGLPYFGGSLPMFVYTAMFFGQTEKTTRICFIFLRHLFLYVTGTTIYGLCIPERIFPRTFDIWGHSHQLFHTLVVFGARDQYLLLCEFMKVPEELPEIELSQILSWVLSTLVICLFIVIYYIYVLKCQSKNKFDVTVTDNNNVPKKKQYIMDAIPARKRCFVFSN